MAVDENLYDFTDIRHVSSLLDVDQYHLLIFNLLPVFPMDGGGYARIACNEMEKRHGYLNCSENRTGV